MRYEIVKVDDLQKSWPKSIPLPEFDIIGTQVKGLTFRGKDGAQVRIRALQYQDAVEISQPLLPTLWRVSFQGLVKEGFASEQEARDFADNLNLPRAEVAVESYT